MIKKMSDYINKKGSLYVDTFKSFFNYLFTAEPDKRQELQALVNKVIIDIELYTRKCKKLILF